MAFVDPASDGYFASVSVIIYVMSYNIGPHYNGTWLYLFFSLTQTDSTPTQIAKPLTLHWLDVIPTGKRWIYLIMHHGRIPSWVTKTSSFMVTNALFYFLYAIVYPENTIPLKQSPITHFAIITKDGLFIVMSPELICVITQTWGTGIVTSYLLIVLACANWPKGNLL